MQTIDSVYDSLRLVLIPERRSLQSELELAADTLANAAHHLVTEQDPGQGASSRAKRDAIAILCQAGREIAQQERRSAARQAIRAWIKAAA